LLNPCLTVEEVDSGAAISVASLIWGFESNQRENRSSSRFLPDVMDVFYFSMLIPGWGVLLTCKKTPQVKGIHHFKLRHLGIKVPRRSFESIWNPWKMWTIKKSRLNAKKGLCWRVSHLLHGNTQSDVCKSNNLAHDKNIKTFWQECPRYPRKPLPANATSTLEYSTKPKRWQKDFPGESYQDK